MLDKMKSSDTFDIRVFVTKSNKSSPSRRSLITEVVSLETWFRRSVLSFIKLGKWSEK